jgi:hypothetical protein
VLGLLGSVQRASRLVGEPIERFDRRDLERAELGVAGERHDCEVFALDTQSHPGGVPGLGRTRSSRYLVALRHQESAVRVVENLDRAVLRARQIERRVEDDPDHVIHHERSVQPIANGQ